MRKKVNTTQTESIYRLRKEKKKKKRKKKKEEFKG